MKSDTYSKIALSVIAGCLLLQLGQQINNPPPVSAEQVHIQHVIIDDLGPTLSDRGLPIARSGPQQVFIEGINSSLSVPIQLKEVGFALKAEGGVPTRGATTWQYLVGSCSSATVSARGSEEWELVQAVWDMSTATRTKMKPGEFEEQVGQVSLCYFKKPLLR